jgi:hypothetical protein
VGSCLSFNLKATNKPCEALLNFAKCSEKGWERTDRGAGREDGLTDNMARPITPSKNRKKEK